MQLGIDLGSRKAKFALVVDGQLRELADRDTIPFYRSHGRMEGDELVLDLAAAGLFPALPLTEARLVVTGYGRNTVALRGATVISELRAHVAGAAWQTGHRDFTLLDLGGQDTKVALVRDGKLQDFVMNDKCAASSGRYLETMAAVLDVPLAELASHWQEPVPLSATCGIFGESELIGQVLRGHPLPRLCAGVNQALVKRILPLVTRHPSETIVVTGGVALNGALIHLLRAASGREVLVPRHPQHNGAIGCAVWPA